MKTTELPQSLWNDEQAAGSQSQPVSHNTAHYSLPDKEQRIGHASNDDSYKGPNHLSDLTTIPDSRNISSDTVVIPESAYKKETKPTIDSGYKKSTKKFEQSPSSSNDNSGEQIEPLHTDFYTKKNYNKNQKAEQVAHKKSDLSAQYLSATSSQIPERVFMNGLIKHTAIALAIIIPLAAFSAYAAAPQNIPLSISNNGAVSTTVGQSATLAVEPSDIIHKAANIPTSVDSVDLQQYAGTWYEIGRLPMYFQRNCDHNVTATYTEKTDGSGIMVLNQCSQKDGSAIKAEGIAKPVNSSGSKLKVSFLPTWLRWLPVGKADYWVLARDSDYKTALVGTPNKKYLWLLARTPNISQQTYTKYRQIAQQQGYDLKEFQLTNHTNQSVSLLP